ncbi:hypothetical protein [Sporosarcina sp. YIM B06819]
MTGTLHVVKEACIETGEITPNNKVYSNGMHLSPRGAEIVLEEIAKYS